MSGLMQQSNTGGVSIAINNFEACWNVSIGHMCPIICTCVQIGLLYSMYVLYMCMTSGGVLCMAVF